MSALLFTTLSLQCALILYTKAKKREIRSNKPNGDIYP